MEEFRGPCGDTKDRSVSSRIPGDSEASGKNFEDPVEVRTASTLSLSLLPIAIGYCYLTLPIACCYCPSPIASCYCPIALNIACCYGMIHGGLVIGRSVSSVARNPFLSTRTMTSGFFHPPHSTTCLSKPGPHCWLGNVDVIKGHDLHIRGCFGLLLLF